MVVAGIGLIIRSVRVGRDSDRDDTLPPPIHPTPGPRNFPVPQFMQTSTRRVPKPRATVSNMRVEALKDVEVRENESSFEMLNLFLVDVRDALGADEVVFWRWSEGR